MCIVFKITSFNAHCTWQCMKKSKNSTNRLPFYCPWRSGRHGEMVSMKDEVWCLLAVMMLFNDDLLHVHPKRTGPEVPQGLTRSPYFLFRTFFFKCKKFRHVLEITVLYSRVGWFQPFFYIFKKVPLRFATYFSKITKMAKKKFFTQLPLLVRKSAGEGVK
jgi:hypothetical protein